MRFRIFSSYWDRPDKMDTDFLLRDHPCLKEFNLEVENAGDVYHLFVQVDTLAQLMELIDKVCFPVIIDYDSLSIEIYDCRREED